MKNILLLLTLFTSLVSWGQRVNIDELTVSNDTYSLNGSSYNGSVYGLYDSGQLKEEFQVKNGRIEGDKIIYYQDNSFRKDHYKDTTIITQTQSNLTTLNNELSSLEKDITGYIQRNLNLRSEMGYKHFGKYKDKYNEGTLKGKKLELYEDYLNNTKRWDETESELNDKRIERDKVEQKLNTEKNKSEYSHKKKDVYQYSNGLCSLHKEFDKNEKLVLEEELKDGVKNGFYKRYENGKVKEEGTYLNNKKDGLWTLHKEYDKYEKLLVEEELKDGVRNGSFKRYENGKVKEEGTYLNNKKDGLWTFHSYNGKEEITFSNDLMNGDYKKYNGDVVVTQGQYSNGLRTGDWKDYDNQGVLTKDYIFIDDKLDGPYKEYSGDVVVKEGQYSNGLMNGEWKDYDNQGVLTKDYNFIDDKLNGPYKEYSGDVVLKEGQYSNGLMNGEWIFRYDSGNLKGEGKYIDGNGGKISENWAIPEWGRDIPENGRVGSWILYDENNIKREKITYTDGLLIQYILYYENGHKERELDKNTDIDRYYNINGILKSTWIEGKEVLSQEEKERLKKEELESEQKLSNSEINCSWCSKSFKPRMGTMLSYSGNMECNRDLLNELRLTSVDVNNIYCKKFCSRKCAEEYCESKD